MTSSIVVSIYTHSNNLTREGLMEEEIKFTDGKISSRTSCASNLLSDNRSNSAWQQRRTKILFDSDANLIGINVGFLDNSKIQ